jgi:hypothetical protein
MIRIAAAPRRPSPIACSPPRNRRRDGRAASAPARRPIKSAAMPKQLRREARTTHSRGFEAGHSPCNPEAGWIEIAAHATFESRRAP